MRGFLFHEKTALLDCYISYFKKLTMSYPISKNVINPLSIFPIIDTMLIACFILFSFFTNFQLLYYHLLSKIVLFFIFSNSNAYLRLLDLAVLLHYICFYLFFCCICNKLSLIILLLSYIKKVEVKI